MLSLFIWAACVKEETENSGSERPLFHAQVQATGTRCHRVHWAHSQAGTLREGLELWFQVGGSILYCLYQERAKPTLASFTFLSAKRERRKGTGERQLFFFFFKKTVYLFIFMRMCVGGNGDAHACLKTEKGIWFAGDGVIGDYDLPSVNGRNWAWVLCKSSQNA